MTRENRKKEHLEFALKTADFVGDNGFSDIFLIYEALPELDLERIDTSCGFLGKSLKAPLLINAMTGGHPDVKPINRGLARAAARTGIAMAVGSQTAGLENREVRDTFKIARDENPDGILLANLSALASPEMVLEAVDMVGADGIQLHLNVAQELAMAEGDRCFTGTLANIEAIVRQAEVPVIVKEVGSGFSRESVRRLYGAGVRYMDVGGRGGTDFVKIEEMRSGRPKTSGFSNLGLTSAVSLIETLSLNLPVTLIASGGFTGGTDVAAALTVGASLVGLAGHFLQVYARSGESGLADRIEEIGRDLRKTMLMLGAGSLEALACKPVVITGGTAEWLLRRGIDISQYGVRSRL